MRGEHGGRLSARMWRMGSSPHARGTLNPATPEIDQTGIIPACAGNTMTLSSIVSFRWDHPRMRGEHSPSLSLSPSPSGSSPHARGTRNHLHQVATRHGIIPACAGNTFPAVTSDSSSRDHPRMRGEHRIGRSTSTSTIGSSPHARGTPTTPSPSPKTPWDHPRMRGEHNQAAQMSTDLTGSSPHARGTLACKSTGIMSSGDHPRMRGEHLFFCRFLFSGVGSSPHARGTLSQSHPYILQSGIIPACAGNTLMSSLRCPPSRDHPRMRGEHLFPRQAQRGAPGSSPHARGTPYTNTWTKMTVGIIPACAGNTYSQRVSMDEETDHPRMRGEHWRERNRLFPLLGSSPHARGTLALVGEKEGQSGIIPACAGNTTRRVCCVLFSRDHPRMRGEHV